jgi:hypothetical protein
MRRLCASLACIAALLAGCGESTLRTDKTEQTVARFVSEHTHFHPTDVRCPSGIPAKVGETFQCHFTGPEGPYTADVRILEVEGARVLDHIVTRPTGEQTAH